MNAYDFKVKKQDGGEAALSDYKGKVLLIVNTATECGFTPQYSELQQLYDEFHGRGLEILDFPCNQFGAQAPGNDEEIYSFCTGRYGITFPQFSKIDVNGENAIPLYKWLTENSSFVGFDDNPMGQMMSQILAGIDKNFQNNSSIKWNFTKFLIGSDGQIVARFEATTPTEKIKEKILEIL